MPVGAIVGVVGAVVGAVGSLIGGMQQASAMNAQAAAQEQYAQQQLQIANYNAEMQRQNTMVAYQMAQAQAQSAANLAQFNQAVALSNQSLAEFQALGARQQYEQGLLNAQQKDIESEAVRARGREEQSRARQENALRISQLRSKYAASGVSFEGTPLEVLSDAAGLGEVAVQDMAYATELESRKTIREAELTRWGAGFALIDEYGFKVQAENYKNQAIRYEYETNLAGYDSAIAGAQAKIGFNQAKLIELGGKVEYNAGMFEAAQSRYAAQGAMVGGMFGAASGLLSGVGSAMGGFKAPSSSGSLLGASNPMTASRAGAGYYSGGRYG
jgi:hypothetical protein